MIFFTGYYVECEILKLMNFENCYLLDIHKIDLGTIKSKSYLKYASVWFSHNIFSFVQYFGM